MDDLYYQLIVVDDEERARRSLSKYLDWHALGFHVTATLEDDSDAIAYLQKHPVDAVLTDIQMFEVSGLELGRRIQANCRETRVVILSGYDEIEYVHAAIQSEAVDFLVKPALKDALIRAFEKVRKKLDEQRAGRYSLRYLTSPDVEEKENALAARLIKNVYQRLEREGVLMPEEYSQEAVYRQLDGMQDHLNLSAVYAMVLLALLLIAFTAFSPLNRIITAIEAPVSAPPAVRPRQGKGMQEVERIIQSVYDLRSNNTAMQSRLNEQLHEFSLEQVRALQHQMDPHVPGELGRRHLHRREQVRARQRDLRRGRLRVGAHP